MSSITRIQTKLVDRKAVIAAVEDLGLPWDDGGIGGSSEQVHFRVRTERGVHVEFVPGQDGYEVVAPPDSRLGNLVSRITQRYAYHMTKRTLEAQGFEFVEEETRQDGRLHLVARRMA